MEKINRNLSVHFNSKLFTGIKHEDILSELENEINLEDIKSIQMTEKSCIVTLKSEQAKYKILNSEISLKNRSVNFFEIDKNVTNVTIKDAPCEVSDQFIATHMSKYGQVINGSIKRGVIKGTNIENGTRYVQILNCAPILPVRTNFGRFEIRLYADNNRTECSYCQQTNHPYYRCPTKPTSIKTCYNCNKQGHIAKYCKYDILCKHCGECGHIQRDCPAHKDETARKEYGDYFHEIIEGRNTRDNSSLDDETERKDTSGQADSNPTTDDNNSVNVLLGASNCKRLGKVSPNCINASISGATLENIDETIKLAKSKVFDKTVDKVVISLGTNDITKSKGDHDQVNINLTHAIHQVKCNFPNSVVGICTILPRKGKGPNITKCNDTVLNVNIFLKKLCIREQIECVDAYELFTKQGNVLKSLFDNTDSSGVHISVEGCTKIRDEIVTFFDSDKVISVELKTPRKRTNSALSSTPNSVERQNKQTRIVSPPV